MGMVVFFGVDIFHWEIAGDRHSTGAADRIEINVWRAFEDVFGEQLAIDFDPQLVVQFGDLDALVFRGAHGARKQHHSSNSQQSTRHDLNVKTRRMQVKGDWGGRTGAALHAKSRYLNFAGKGAKVLLTII